MFALLAFSLLACLGGSAAKLHLDSNEVLTVDQLRCALENASYVSFTGRVWQTHGQYDLNGMANIKNAKAAGYSTVDAAFHPCVGTADCTSAGNQIEATVNKLKTLGVDVDIMWIVVSGADGTWSGRDLSRDFMNSLLMHAGMLGVKVGIRTDLESFESAFGREWDQLHNMPLWWEYDDGKQDFTSFTAFGGWKEPTRHKFANGAVGLCGIKTSGLSWSHRFIGDQ